MSVSIKHNFIFLRNHKCGSATTFYILKPFCSIIGENFSKDVFPNKLNHKPWVHSDAGVWRKYLHYNKIYKNFKTITTVRNPWARMVSLYNYGGIHKKLYGQNGFEQFIEDVFDHYSFVNFIFDKKGKNVDYVIKIEELETELPKLMKKFGINLSTKDFVFRLNKTKSVDYKKYYNDKTKEIVRKKFKKEIDFFKYEF